MQEDRHEAIGERADATSPPTDREVGPEIGGGPPDERHLEIVSDRHGGVVGAWWGE